MQGIARINHSKSPPDLIPIPVYHLIGLDVNIITETPATVLFQRSIPQACRGITRSQLISVTARNEDRALQRGHYPATRARGGRQQVQSRTLNHSGGKRPRTSEKISHLLLPERNIKVTGTRHTVSAVFLRKYGI